MKNILVLCTGNSCRSQMAHGYLRKLLVKQANIYSAGIEKHGLNPYAVSVMKMDGVDISSNSSNLIDEYMSIEFYKNRGAEIVEGWSIIHLSGKNLENYV